MCGIFALVNPHNKLTSQHLRLGSQIISHRGPDDEGYLLCDTQYELTSYSGHDTNNETRERLEYPRLRDDERFHVGLGHRRLSIIDLSPQGHQPMVDEESGLALTYNGEIYNYKELRTILEALGHIFHGESDTEVLLKAWKEWGVQAPQHFNGMFAFVILDTFNHFLYAIRDRFGIKPLYFTALNGYIAFASEIKQLRILPEYTFYLNENNAFDYLRYGIVDHNNETFEKEIQQVGMGSYIKVNLNNYHTSENSWYELNPIKWNGSFNEACEKFSGLLKDSVRLRLRSDVPIGSALSGGLDSSSVVCLMNEVLKNESSQDIQLQTVTSCFEDFEYDEWEFAKEVIAKVNSKSHRVFPSYEKLMEDLDNFLWHMDYPVSSTSQFSQWSVFEGAANAGLKVMLNGQGADEQLAGYGGNDMSLYTGLLRYFKIIELYREVRSYRKYSGHWPFAFVIGAIQNMIPEEIINIVPDRYRVLKQFPPPWLKMSETSSQQQWPRSLKESLIGQIKIGPLPSLLRYEDRNSMAFSIESRVPFMDYRLIEFTLGLPEKFVYKRGERKHILRRAFDGRIPRKILERRDKMGFMSTEKIWLTGVGKSWFKNEIIEASQNLDFLINKEESVKMFDEMSNGNRPFNSSPWHIISLNRFIKSV